MSDAPIYIKPAELIQWFASILRSSKELPSSFTSIYNQFRNNSSNRNDPFWDAYPHSTNPPTRKEIVEKLSKDMCLPIFLATEEGQQLYLIMFPYYITVIENDIDKCKEAIRCKLRQIDTLHSPQYFNSTIVPKLKKTVNDTTKQVIQWRKKWEDRSIATRSLLGRHGPDHPITEEAINSEADAYFALVDAETKLLRYQTLYDTAKEAMARRTYDAATIKPMRDEHESFLQGAIKMNEDRIDKMIETINRITNEFTTATATATTKKRKLSDTL